MRSITHYVDSLFDLFPVNKQSIKIRKTLLNQIGQDYLIMKDQGMNKKEIRKTIIDAIADENTIAHYIPNRNSLLHYLIIIGLAVGAGFIIQYISEENFLQLFLPYRVEFPIIIRDYIYHILTVFFAYVIFKPLYSALPEKIHNRPNFTYDLFAYLATIILGIYLATSVAFSWWTFNGYVPARIEASPFGLFLSIFYKIFILKLGPNIALSIFTGILILFATKSIHLDFSPEPFALSDIYTSPVDKETIVEETTETEVKDEDALVEPLLNEDALVEPLVNEDALVEPLEEKDIVEEMSNPYEINEVALANQEIADTEEEELNEVPFESLAETKENVEEEPSELKEIPLEEITTSNTNDNEALKDLLTEIKQEYEEVKNENTLEEIHISDIDKEDANILENIKKDQQV